MAYTKLLAVLRRTSASNLRNARISLGRCRSSVASTKRQEDKEQPLDGCPVVEAVPVKLISPTIKAAEAPRTQIHIDFDNTQEAYKSKGNLELLRSLLVFNLCTIDVLVEKNKEVRQTGRLRRVGCCLSARS